MPAPRTCTTLCSHAVPGVALGPCVAVIQLAELASVCKDISAKQVCDEDGGGRDQAAAGGWYYVPVCSAVPSPGAMPCASPTLAVPPSQDFPTESG